jgi:tetratricopeptide (TPR) repeat protein
MFLNGRIRSIISLGNINSFIGNAHMGERYCKLALHLSDSVNNDALLSESYNLQYLLHYRSGNYDSAFTSANKSFELATMSNHKKMLARGNQNLGILNSIRGFHAKAIEHFLISENYYREQGDEFALAMVLGNLGVTFEEAGNYEKALEYMQMELKIGQDLKDNFLISNALADIGAVYSQMNLPDSSIGYYERSLAIAQDANNYDLIILNLENIGSYYSSKEQFSKATSYLMSAYNTAIKKGFEYQNVYITGHLAQNYLEQGKNDSALIFANEQLKLALNYEFLYDQKLAYQNLANIYAAKNQFMPAYGSLQKLIVIYDSLYAKEKMEQIEMLREQYETAQKE